MAYRLERCAASRTMVSLAQPGRTRRNVLGSTAYPESKDKGGQQHAVRAVVNERRETLMRCKTRTIWVRLHCLKPNLRSGRAVVFHDSVGE